MCLDLVQKMAYAMSEAEYDLLHDQFQPDAPKEVVLYFNDSWHPIRNECPGYGTKVKLWQFPQIYQQSTGKHQWKTQASDQSPQLIRRFC